MLSRLTDDADRSYRERFLRERYGLDVSPAPDSLDGPGTETTFIVEIVDEELAGADPGHPGAADDVR